ncbi:MAG TPA: prolyl oligopeptidase family serine peptidase [Rubrivivax sp.]|nr:prolyl oligopeptidase family serine peptidase [Burkholderiales bacterium]HNT37721.1 prolyl oligopeptidase family serine peptidase [Rubrivivax sp.]
MNPDLQPPTPPDDPFRWLEEVQGERALAWVRERNAIAERELQAVSGHAERERAILEVLDSQARIPAVQRVGPWLYNLWQDAANPRGLWRRATLAEFRKPAPAWETVLDLDALGRAEGENWTWGGATLLGPAYRHALLSLSRGGADAHVVREFDLVDKRFVANGFFVPEAKSSVEWIDADHLFVGSDFGPGSLTDSGYPRVIRRWRRGQPLAQAPVAFEGEAGDVAANAFVDRTPGFERSGFVRATSFYESRLWLLQDGKPVEVDKPLDATLSFWGAHLLLQLRSDWAVAGRHWRGGSLLLSDAAAYLRGQREFTALFEPAATRSLERFATTRTQIVLEVLDTVSSRLEAWRLESGAQGEARWLRRELPAPPMASTSIAALHDPLLPDDPLAEQLWLRTSSFLTPDALQLARIDRDGDRIESVKALPAFFDAAGMRVEQHFARSADGTRVPYFVVWPKTPRRDGRNPTLLYGYGGFEVSLTPAYLAIAGRTWLEQGGVYVLANVRGGGEFGPAWHQAAILAHKQRSYDDFAAVAEDLVARGITQARHLGIQGGSNGGLLVGAVMLQRPELFGAVVCQVPLLDMRRYHRLLAGASWMAEYGNPDDPAQWAWIARYSPYQNLKPGKRLPAVLFTTSTRDDRVHPGHARKMAARMLALGYHPLYWENVEGGHGGAADNAQRARMRALELSFLWRELAPR